MGSKSGATREAIALPKGGGALHGIGEKFSPDLHTGTGNFSVPLALPPGRNGFQPQLNLVYSTGQGNGYFGLGWSLSIPGVSRRTAKGVPSYDDAQDVFILSGAEDLVPTEQLDSQTTRYQPRTEGLFAKILHHRDIQNDYWEVCSKDGLISYYGTPGMAGNDAAVTAKPDPSDPNDRSRVFAWKLTLTKDPFGNQIQYLYDRDQSREGDKQIDHQWDQPLLRQILYADYTDRESNLIFLVSVTFQYEARTDAFSEYRAGFEIRTTQLCTSILVETHPKYDSNRTDYGVRRYEFEYANDALNGAALLSAVRVTGFDDAGDPDQELPPLSFRYTTFEPQKRRFFPVTSAHLPAQSLASHDLELADLTGDGLPDILEMNGPVRYWRNLGNGQFDLPRPMRDAPAGLALADVGVQLIDADGDGRIDLLASKDGLSGYFPLRFDGTWDRRSFRRYRSAPSFNFEDPEVKLVDLDGDGVTDAIRSGTRLECFFNDPHDGWLAENTRWVERRALEEFPNVNFSDPRVKWGDMTGDGLQDIVLVYDGDIEYWPNLGRGDWGRRIHMGNSPCFQDYGYTFGYDPKRVLLGDVDGDGLADIVYVGNDQVVLWINQSGDSWSNPIVIQGTPHVTDIDSVRLVDLLGTGISGVLWSAGAAANGNGRPHMFFLDFTGGVKPYLLDEMDNHIGAITRVEYRPSIYYYLEDRKSPKTRWRTSLPFPVQVVAKVEVIDAISKGKLTTEYRYHHGYWDGGEREFRGFGMVEQYDTESFEIYNETGLHGEGVNFERINEQQHFSAPTLTKTWFHQGPVGDEFGDWEELDYEKEFWREDPPLFERPLEMRQFLGSLPRRVKRDALRALRGSILRTELYALDENQTDPDRCKRPYTVTESLYGVCEVLVSNGLPELSCQLQPGDSAAKLGVDDPQRIFFPHVLAQRTTQWERGHDPMTQFAFTDEYDDFGQPQRHTTVAMPRRSLMRHSVTGAIIGQIQPDETNILATHTWTTYAKPQGDVYIHDRVAQVKTYELESPRTLNEGDSNDVKGVLRDQAVEADTVRDLFIAQSNQRLIGHTVNHYDGSAFEGLPVGEVGKYGALTRREALFFNSELMDEAYKGDPGKPSRRPACLDGSQTLPAGAPVDFGSNIGYRFETGSADYSAGHYADTKREKFDFQDSAAIQPRGMMLAGQDGLKHETRMTLDEYWLRPVKVVDAANLNTVASYNYRVMQPAVVTDANANKTHFRYSPIGSLNKAWLESNQGKGGSETKPELEYHYDFLNYDKAKSMDPDKPQPIYARTISRVHHASENISDETIETYEYSDGFGRLIQKRTQAEEIVFGAMGDDVGLLPGAQALPGSKPAVGQRDADRVVVSGWQIHNNKGRVVEKYEPFFDVGWQYQPREEAKQGKHVTMFYDPRGQVISTVNPDGSEQRVIFGVPGAIGEPDLRKVNAKNDIEFEPSPWESYTYDPNDLAAISKDSDTGVLLTGHAPASHHYTPASTLLDGLGRVICTVQRNGPDPSKDWYVTRSRYDIRGNVLEVIDPLGLSVFKHAYDLLNRPLRADSIDAGLCTSVLDVQGNLIEYRDSKGSIVLCEYDELNRLIHLWAMEDTNATQQFSLRERIIYGDKANLPDATARNILAKPYVHYDEAGKLTFDRYDFKGNLTYKARQVITDQAMATGWATDWQGEPPDESNLEPAASSSYEISTSFDALNRPTAITYPKDVNGHRTRLTPLYNRGGALQAVQLDNETYVAHIAYNAKGQRVLVAYGNGVMTRYAYDPRTFRLVRLRTEKFSKPDELTWKSVSTSTPKEWLFQDLTYSYDLAGNITAIQDRTPEGGLPAMPDQLDRVFEYDPTYRLVRATGREYAAAPPSHIWDDTIHPPDLTKTAPYMQTYSYDGVGNLSQLRHTAANSYTKDLSLAPNQNGDHSNRLKSVTVGTGVYAYQYDDNGNMVQESLSRYYYWDHADRMVGFKCQNCNSVSVDARYLYDASGMRVKKWVRTNGTGEGNTTVYIDGIFEYSHWKKPGQPEGQNNHLHVMDDRSRIALLRVGTKHPDDGGPAVQYHLGDHLGSSNVVIGGQTVTANDLINREEYYPYGETSFGSFGKKRYRFTSKGRDEESGLCYHGARYFAPWLARWVSCDPIGMVGRSNLYCYAKANPVRLMDPSGQQDKPAPEEEALQASLIAGSSDAQIINGAQCKPTQPTDINAKSDQTSTLKGPWDPWNLDSYLGFFDGEKWRTANREIEWYLHDLIPAQQKQWDQAAAILRKKFPGEEAKLQREMAQKVQPTIYIGETEEHFVERHIGSRPSKIGIFWDLGKIYVPAAISGGAPPNLARTAGQSGGYSIIYHGTSSNRASLILQEGFRTKDAIFFAEDMATAETFAFNSRVPPGGTSPASFTVMQFKVPNHLAEELGLSERHLIGEFRTTENVVQVGASPYERILYSEQTIAKFNSAITDGTVQVSRLRCGY